MTRTPARTQSIDLYRDLRAAHARHAIGIGPMLVAAAAVVFALGTHVAFEQRALRAQRAELARVQADAQRLQRVLAVAPVAADASAREEAEVAALERLAARLGADGLGRTTGFSDALTALARATTDGVWLTGISLDNQTGHFALEGMALDAARVPLLLAALKRQPRFDGTAFARIEMQPAEEAARGVPTSTVRFRIATAKSEPKSAQVAAATGVAP